MAPPQYQDLQRTCIDCGQPWTFTAGEQEFFAQRELQEPKRCADCRAK